MRDEPKINHCFEISTITSSIDFYKVQQKHTNSIIRKVISYVKFLVGGQWLKYSICVLDVIPYMF